MEYSWNKTLKKNNCHDRQF